MANNITLIITTYNDGLYLKRSINSVVRQKLKPNEIIIVDDGSSNKDAQFIVEEFTKTNDDIIFTYIYQKNMGPSAARNTGILNSNTKYITFLDADDELTENSIEPRLSKLKSCGDEYFGVYGTGITSKKGKLDFLKFDGIPKPELIGYSFTGIPGGSCFYIFTKDSIIKAGLYDTSLRNNEDFDLIIRISNLGFKCNGPACCSNFINVRDGSLSRTPNPRVSFEMTLKFLLKAEKLHYFSSVELNNRKKSAHLACAKKLLINDTKEACHLILRGFYYSKPSSIKEKLLRIFSRIIITLLQ